MISKAIKILVVLLLTTTLTVYAQSKYSNWEIGGGIAAMLYQGDLTTHRLGSIETVRPGFLVFVNYKLPNQLKLQLAYNQGSLSGDDSRYNNPSYRRLRNYAFATPVKELSVKLVYNLLKYSSDDEVALYPYIAAGVNLGFYNITKNYSNLSPKLTDAQPSILAGLAQDNSKTLPKRLLTIPLVVGVRKPITERLDMFTELNYRVVFTDYIDGFSKAANAKRQDKYYSLNLGVVYKFKQNNSLKCPNY